MIAARGRGLRAGACLALAWIALGGEARAQRATPAPALSSEPAPDPAPPSSQSEPDRVPTTPAKPATTPPTTSTKPGPDPAADPTSEALPKKDRDLADKRARQAAFLAASPAAPPKLVSKIGVKPALVINIFHRWTEEYLPIAATGPLPSPELQNRLLRDHYTNQPTQMATRLVPALVAAARKFGVYRVEIVSGYRHPKYNLILRKKGHQVARDSEHSHGSAVDFRLPGVTTEKLAQWAHALRLGGVGTYLSSQFVHIDVGPIRRWSGE